MKVRAEGTGFIHPTFFSKMATLTYRGVKYDTDKSTACSRKAVSETYRGIKHTENVEVCK